MSLDQVLVAGVYSFVCLVSIVFMAQRLRWRYTRRGFRPRGAMLGNALQRLQVIAEPPVAHVLEEKLEEEAEDDAEGGPDDPVRHLHRQARRIRRGERVDRLTARLGRR